MLCNDASLCAHTEGSLILNERYKRFAMTLIGVRAYVRTGKERERD